MRFYVSVKVPFLVQSFQTDDNFSQNFSGFVEGKDLIFEFGLIVDEVASVAVLEDEIDVGIVFFYVIEFDDVG